MIHLTEILKVFPMYHLNPSKIPINRYKAEIITIFPVGKWKFKEIKNSTQRKLQIVILRPFLFQLILCHALRSVLHTANC